MADIGTDLASLTLLPLLRSPHPGLVLTACQGLLLLGRHVALSTHRELWGLEAARAVLTLAQRDDSKPLYDAFLGHLVTALSWLRKSDLMWAAPRCVVALFGVVDSATRLGLVRQVMAILVSCAAGSAQKAVAEGAAEGAAEEEEEEHSYLVISVLRAAPVVGVCKRGAAGAVFRNELLHCAIVALLQRRPPATPQIVWHSEALGILNLAVTRQELWALNSSTARVAVALLVHVGRESEHSSRFQQVLSTVATMALHASYPWPTLANRPRGAGAAAATATGDGAVLDQGLWLCLMQVLVLRWDGRGEPPHGQDSKRGLNRLASVLECTCHPQPVSRCCAGVVCACPDPQAPPSAPASHCRGVPRVPENRQAPWSMPSAMQHPGCATSCRATAMGNARRLGGQHGASAGNATPTIAWTTGVLLGATAGGVVWLWSDKGCVCVVCLATDGSNVARLCYGYKIASPLP